MNQIATQPCITDVKRLHGAKTQIFNNWSEGRTSREIRRQRIISNICVTILFIAYLNIGKGCWCTHGWT